MAIDEQSITNLDRRPWLRELHNKMLDLLANAHDKVVGGKVSFPELQADAGLAYINKTASPLKFSAPQNTTDSLQQSEARQLNTLLQEAAQHLDNDGKPGDGMAKANHAVLPMFFGLGESQGKPGKLLPVYVNKALLDIKGAAEGGHIISSTDCMCRLATAWWRRCMVLGWISSMLPVWHGATGQGRREQVRFASLGASLNQMVCGKLPLEGGLMMQLMFRIANEPPADTLRFRQNALRCVAKFINKALAKDMAKRYQAGQEMAGVIRKYAADLA